jgi:hypothetical protein
MSQSLRFRNKPLSTPLLYPDRSSTCRYRALADQFGGKGISYPQLLPFEIGVIHSYSPTFHTAHLGVSVIMRILRSTTIAVRGWADVSRRTTQPFPRV